MKKQWKRITSKKSEKKVGGKESDANDAETFVFIDKHLEKICCNFSQSDTFELGQMCQVDRL